MNIFYKISVVQAYINHMTGKTVQINPPENPRELMLLEQAYQKAMSVLDSVKLTY